MPSLEHYYRGDLGKMALVSTKFLSICLHEAHNQGLLSSGTECLHAYI